MLYVPNRGTFGAVSLVGFSAAWLACHKSIVAKMTPAVPMVVIFFMSLTSLVLKLYNLMISLHKLNFRLKTNLATDTATIKITK